MKTTMKNLIMVGIIFAAIFMLSSCEKEIIGLENEEFVSILKVDDDGTSSVIESNLKSVLLETPVLTDDELDLLIEMKEEEKLAHDVYVALYEIWGSNIFSRISFAEERHVNAIIRLLEYYGLEEIQFGEPGIFTIDKFQALYNDLVTAGSVSVEEAMKIGALIEEMDIVDLTEALGVVSNDNIIMVFENLIKASRNHLRAFNRQLKNLGITYVPVYLSQEEFDEIINTPMETGKKYRVNWKEGDNIQNRHAYRNGNGDGKYNGPGEGNSYGEQNGEGNSYGEQDGEGNSYGEQDGEGNETQTQTQTQTGTETQTQTGTGTGSSNGNGN
jgi:hypothetical protein